MSNTVVAGTVYIEDQRIKVTDPKSKRPVLKKCTGAVENPNSLEDPEILSGQKDDRSFRFKGGRLHCLVSGTVKCGGKEYFVAPDSWVEYDTWGQNVSAQRNNNSEVGPENRERSLDKCEAPSDAIAQVSFVRDATQRAIAPVLISPVVSSGSGEPIGVLTSPYGGRHNPMGGGHSMHKGVDFRVIEESGAMSNIVAAADGIITYAGQCNLGGQDEKDFKRIKRRNPKTGADVGFGKKIEITHSDIKGRVQINACGGKKFYEVPKFKTLYAHLDSFSESIQKKIHEAQIAMLEEKFGKGRTEKIFKELIEDPNVVSFHQAYLSTSKDLRKYKPILRAIVNSLDRSFKANSACVLNIPVKAGEVLGVGGNTGSSSAAHLHFAVWLGNSDDSPLDCASAPGRNECDPGLFLDYSTMSEK